MTTEVSRVVARRTSHPSSQTETPASQRATRERRSHYILFASSKPQNSAFRVTLAMVRGPHFASRVVAHRSVIAPAPHQANNTPKAHASCTPGSTGSCASVDSRLSAPLYESHYCRMESSLHVDCTARACAVLPCLFLQAMGIRRSAPFL